MLVDRRRQHVRGHDRRDVLFDRGPKGQQLHLVQPARIVFDHRQLVVRVDDGVAVSGEMLAARGDAGRLQRPHDHAAAAAPRRTARSERARSPIT